MKYFFALAVLIILMSCENQNTPTVVEPPIVVDSSKKAVDFLNNTNFKFIKFDYIGFNCSYYSSWYGTNGSGSGIDSNLYIYHYYESYLNFDSLKTKDSIISIFFSRNYDYLNKFQLSFKFEKETSKLDSFYFGYITYKVENSRTKSIEERNVRLNFKSVRYELLNDTIFSISINYDELQKSFKSFNYSNHYSSTTYFGATYPSSSTTSDGYVIAFKEFSKGAYFNLILSK